MGPAGRRCVLGERPPGPHGAPGADWSVPWVRRGWCGDACGERQGWPGSTWSAYLLQDLALAPWGRERSQPPPSTGSAGGLPSSPGSPPPPLAGWLLIERQSPGFCPVPHFYSAGRLEGAAVFF